MELEAGMGVSPSPSGFGHFDVSNNIALVPPFREAEVDGYFSTFERVAGALKWPQEVWLLLLQCRLTGKAQGVVASLSLEDSLNYDVVKATVLRSYELVPEAYRQRFKNGSGNDELSFEFPHVSSLCCHPSRKFGDLVNRGDSVLEYTHVPRESEIPTKAARLESTPLGDILLSATTSNVVEAQKVDGSLATCFQSVVSLEEAKASKRAYYVGNGVLMRKWKAT